MNLIVIDNKIFEIDTMRRTIKYNNHMGQYSEAEDDYVLLKDDLNVTLHLNSNNSLKIIGYNNDELVLEIYLYENYHPGITKKELMYLVENNRYSELVDRMKYNKYSNYCNLE